MASRGYVEDFNKFADVWLLDDDLSLSRATKSQVSTADPSIPGINGQCWDGGSGPVCLYKSDGVLFLLHGAKQVSIAEIKEVRLHDENKTRRRVEVHTDDGVFLSSTYEREWPTLDWLTQMDEDEEWTDFGVWLRNTVNSKERQGAILSYEAEDFSQD